MYKLPYFTEKDDNKVLSFMKENNFAVICGNGKYPIATHIPLDIIEEDGRLKFTGHLMKNTDHHHAFSENENVLVIFNGPHTYVSASWYMKKDVASTWNYITVHAKGKIRFLDNDATLAAIKSITDRYEEKDSPSSFENLSPDYISRLVKAIIAFEITVESFENVFKLSQNHDEDTRKSIIQQLRKKEDEGANKIAAEMAKRI